MHHGVSHSVAAPVASIARNANASAGRLTRRPGTPAERNAVISPSLDIRLKPISTPTRTPNGTVNGNEAGTASANRYATVFGVADARTSSENSPDPTRCRNKMSVNRLMPSIAAAATSAKTERLINPKGDSRARCA